MYVPPAFTAPGKETLLRLMPVASFALLVSKGGDVGLTATHLPFSYDPDRGEFGTLFAHMARGNPHAALLEHEEALVVFQGPHRYISPRYYASNSNVPTWNYVAVHAYGAPSILRDEAAVRAVLGRLTEENERDMPEPWRPEEFDPARYAAMLGAIVAFEIRITRLESKAKLGQNKSAADQAALRAAIGTLWEPEAG